MLREQVAAIRFLCRAPAPAFGELGAREAGTVADVVPAFDGPVEVRVVLKGLVTKEQELARIERALKHIAKDLATADKKLASPAFVERAPKEIVDEVRAAREQNLAARARLEQSRALADERASGSALNADLARPGGWLSENLRRIPLHTR
jgi:valyl-tRNA synthetase